MSARDYDPSVLQDSTGRQFRVTQADKRGPLGGESTMFHNAKLLTCPNCSGEVWRILADDHEDSGLVQFRCANRECRTWLRPIEARKPQLKYDERAKQLGLWLPDTNVVPIVIEEDFDVESD